jgi:hypothetical protein
VGTTSTRTLTADMRELGTLDGKQIGSLGDLAPSPDSPANGKVGGDHTLRFREQAH